MGKPQTVCVKKWALQAFQCAGLLMIGRSHNVLFFSSINAISGDGMPHGGKVHANLMGSPGLNIHIQKCACIESLYNPPFGQCRPSLPGANGHFFSVRRVPANLQRNVSELTLYTPAD
jgi:hypothetical protein